MQRKFVVAKNRLRCETCSDTTKEDIIARIIVRCIALDVLLESWRYIERVHRDMDME